MNHPTDDIAAHKRCIRNLPGDAESIRLPLAYKGTSVSRQGKLCILPVDDNHLRIVVERDYSKFTRRAPNGQLLSHFGYRWHSALELHFPKVAREP